MIGNICHSEGVLDFERSLLNILWNFWINEKDLHCRWLNVLFSLLRWFMRREKFWDASKLFTTTFFACHFNISIIFHLFIPFVPYQTHSFTRQIRYSINIFCFICISCSKTQVFKTQLKCKISWDFLGLIVCMFPCS
jgi:hypothetical protein